MRWVRSRLVSVWVMGFTVTRIAKEKHVVQLGSKLNILVRVNRSEEEVKALPTSRDQRAKGWWDSWTGEDYSHAEVSIRKRIDALTDRMVNAEAERLHEEKRRAHEEAGRDSNAPYYGDMAEARVEAERKREEFRREATEEYMADLGGR